MELTCTHCHNVFTRSQQLATACRRNAKSNMVFCSRKCTSSYFAAKLAITLPCGSCGKATQRQLKEYNKSKSKLIFCSKSCAASYNNRQKRKSTRSRCENLLFALLQKEFPHLVMLPTDHSMLDGFEVDIAIPVLNMAIEWNGIVHFEPIFGDSKLSQIQTRDMEKRIKAQQKGVELIVIPDLVSTPKFVEQAFYDISKRIREKL